ncbi:MAG: T9SS type A sorting domain-containing protein [Prolixibacteraceae bacterium]|nr:T9SS type A sorting domain-containing protein [Prolixibacteraceae bacterium]
MKFSNQLTKFFLFIFIINVSYIVNAQDPNFHVYLCFGQSNMEGQGAIEKQDKTVDERLKVLEAVACSNLSRNKGEWYAAIPPLTRCYSGLSPADYFGRTMVASLPDSITVGIINVSVAGCKIELFDKDNYQSYVNSITESWLKNIINEYGGNPYGHLIEVAKIAQADGVIKGVLLHQGESNTGDQQWPAKVKAVYDNLMADLSLNPDEVPLLAGEVVHADQGGICASMNNIIAKLPQTIANSYVISSSKCADASDNLHFNSAGYRELGFRYATQMLEILGYEAVDPRESDEPDEPGVLEAFYFEPECESPGQNWVIVDDIEVSNGQYVTVEQGIQSLPEAAGTEGQINVQFTTTQNSTYYMYGLMNCPTADDDSFWASFDGGSYLMCNGLATSGWQWKQLIDASLTAGNHTLTITYREDGAQLDKIAVSNSENLPEGLGDEAQNVCNTDTSTVGFLLTEDDKGFLLDQNYPNPVNNKTSIGFEIPQNSHVSIVVYDIRGVEIKRITDMEYPKGKHFVQFDAEGLDKGQYFYRMQAGNFNFTRRMILHDN